STAATTGSRVGRAGRGGRPSATGPARRPHRPQGDPLRAESVGIGTELLLGEIANTNAQWISGRLAEIGVDVVHHQVVGDNVERIADAFHLALSRSDVVIATGGLGPTQDDVTREARASVGRCPSPTSDRPTCRREGE